MEKMNLLQASAAETVNITFEGGPFNGTVQTAHCPGIRMSYHQKDPKRMGTYGLSHAGAGDVLVYMWEGWV